MSCDYYRFLIVKTFNSGRAVVVASSDREEAIETEYLSLKKVYADEIRQGLLRFDIYEK